MTAPRWREVRDALITGVSAVSAPGNLDDSTGGHGVVAGLRSVVRLRGGTEVGNNAGHGVFLFSGSAATFRGRAQGDITSALNGNAGFGL